MGLDGVTERIGYGFFVVVKNEGRVSKHVDSNIDMDLKTGVAVEAISKKIEGF